MMSNPVRRLSAVLIAAAILISGLSLSVSAEVAADVPEDPPSSEYSAIPSVPDESESSEPSESEPETSEPDVSEPDTSEPDVSEPEDPVTESSEPDVSDPNPSEPDASEPNASEPEDPVTESSEPVSGASEASEPTPPLPANASEDSSVSGHGLYFGLLHGHSGISDEADSIETVFQTAANTAGLDFFAVTDHSDSFEGHLSASIGTDGSRISPDWSAGKAAAAAVTCGSFTGIFGYELSWPDRMKIGHINSFGTPGFQSWEQEPYNRYDGALDAYYDTLSGISGSVSQFNHPGSQYGTFDSFRYSAAADRQISLIELDFSAEDPCRYYDEALSKGWHLAPTGSRELSGSVRTAVYAQSLAEDDILDALSRCRTYATEDRDLEILYTMDGHSMGSRLKLRHVGETMDLSVSLRDPSDSAVGLVEVIADGGICVKKSTLSASSGTVSFSIPAAPGFYYLKITQPDGHRAVTAPIWVESEEVLGIASFTCQTQVPVQNEPLSLILELYNRESSPLLVESLEVLADGISVFSDDSLSKIPDGSSLSHPLNLSCSCVGTAELTVKLSGTLDGCPRSYEASLTLQFHQSQQVTSILADSGHGNAGLNRLNQLADLTRMENITFFTGAVSSDTLKNCRFLLVSAPSEPFDENFLKTVSEFAGYGGSLVLCGQSDAQDTAVHSSAELNRLLEAVGSTLRFGDDQVQDSANNAGSITVLNSDCFNTASSWCGGISEDQVFRFADGCTVDPGQGSWLVKGRPTASAADTDSDGLGGTAAGEPVLAACETLSGGGTAVAVGCLFPDDTGLKDPDSLRDPGYANRTLLKNLLGIGADPLPLSTIREVRSGAEHSLFRIRGYVTAGTSNPYNTFPDTIYLQDETGGIAVIPFRETGIQTGTPMEITGYIQTRGGNRIFNPVDWEILNLPMQFTQPESGSWDTLLDTGRNGGKLVEVTGTCIEVYCREDNTLAGFLLKDEKGNPAKIQIDEGIFAGSDGKNSLHKTIRKNRTVWAIGLLHVNENGETVIRVRNCEEVVWVPPRTYLNPRTGDLLLPQAGFCMLLSAAGLLFRKKYKK